MGVPRLPRRLAGVTSQPASASIPPSAPQGAALTVRAITAAEHTEFLARHPLTSFLQNPAWAPVKSEWRAQSLGVHRGDRLVGAALVLGRPLPVPARIPVLGRAFLAYVADGPVLDEGVELVDALEPLVAELKRQGAFLVRMGPPGVVRRWDADVVRKALPDPGKTMLTDLPCEVSEDALRTQQALKDAGWTAPEVSADFAAGQPMFQARIPLEGIDVEGWLARMSGSSRKRTRRSTRNGLDIVTAGPDRLDDWDRLNDETAERDHFTGRPQDYFAGIIRHLGSSPIADVTFYIAEHEGEPVAAAFHFQQGQMAWRPYSASSQRERQRDAPRLLQLTQVEAAIAAGCLWLDLGGVSGSVDQGHKLSGLTEFKTTQGADIVQTHGEWDLPLNRPLAKAFELYMARR